MPSPHPASPWILTMRQFNWYITKNLLGTLALSMGILAFVMLSVHFFRAFSLLAGGVSPWLLGRILLYLFPDILRYVLPLSLLVSTVLVFSRMRSCFSCICLHPVPLLALVCG